MARGLAVAVAARRTAPRGRVPSSRNSGWKTPRVDAPPAASDPTPSSATSATRSVTTSASSRTKTSAAAAAPTSTPAATAGSSIPPPWGVPREHPGPRGRQARQERMRLLHPEDRQRPRRRQGHEAAAPVSGRRAQGVRRAVQEVTAMVGIGCRASGVRDSSSRR